MTMRGRWEGAARLLAEHRDVLDARPGEGDASCDAGEVLAARGWKGFLETLDDEALAAHEIGGRGMAWPDEAPASLRALVERARDVCAIPAFPIAAPVEAAARRHETPRKQAQIDAFAQIVVPLAKRARRVVDVGSGHGHLTREIAERIALPVVGLERDVALADRARRLASEHAPEDAGRARAAFTTTDVMHEGLALEAGDCVIGLHACGELGDAIVMSAARSHASVVLVGCCLQKRAALARVPLCDVSSFGGALDLPRAMLGLSNLTPRDAGVETTRAENLAGRERRLALHRLLSEHGFALPRGAEIGGLNRRAAQRDLVSLVGRAFALRGRPLPPRAAIEEAATWARTEHARIRRASVPRSLLARVIEVFVLLDRALYLEEHGMAVEIGVAFPEEVSARNLVVVGRAT